jgi:NAD(P)-dependent dehydrogenase (short-subunit alcohol dehydrogenase family)
MTDIRQHLPLILACIRQHLAEPAASEAIRTKLRELLPASYGLGVGCLVSAQGERSQPLDIVIYDTTIEPLQMSADPQVYDLRRVLAVIMLGQELETPALQALLQTIASVKLLRPNVFQGTASNERPQTGKKVAQKTVSSLKKLLPLGIVAFQRLSISQAGKAETFALALDALLKEQAEPLRPDYLLAQAQQVFYSQPALAGGTFVESTINIASEPALKKPHPCYVCKQFFTHAHFFYHSLCLPCGDLNYRKRAVPADLSGRIALVTGARVKIGYATALRLLRAGAQVIVTSRFPHNAAHRYSSEPDFADWRDRLHIYGLDFRYLPVVEHFLEHLRATYSALDILVNNAAQTVRRPLDYYSPLLAFEQTPLALLPPVQQVLVQRSHEALPPTPFASAGVLPLTLPADFALPQLPSATLLHDYGSQAVLPPAHPGVLSATTPYGSYGTQIDPRQQNSWTLPFNEIDLTEFLEVQTINVTAPFLLVSHLHPLLCRSSYAQRFIINVSAIEGQFANTKLGNHVHTNMAKAALNMLTHTAAAQLARDCIFMNSVDPGWISQQTPQTDLQHWERLQQLLPLDLVDAAARVCDPIFLCLTTGETSSGRFYKDYRPTSW